MPKVQLSIPVKDIEFSDEITKANSLIVEKLKTLKKHFSTLKKHSLNDEIKFIDILINSAEETVGPLNFFTSELILFDFQEKSFQKIIDNDINYGKGLKSLVKIKNIDLKKKPHSKTKTVKFYKILIGIFDYSKFTDIYYNILQSNELFVCVYCQGQNALYYFSKSESVTKLRWYFNLTLDHILPKSKYPYLAVNINNLAPVCSHCNSRKHDKLINYNPYLDEFNYRFDFDETIEDINAIKINIKKLKLENIDPLKKEKLNAALDIEGLYQHQSFIAQNLLDRYRRFAGNGYSKNVDGIFRDVSEDELKNFISDCNLSESNIFKFPFVRFKISLYNHLVSLENKKS